MVKLVFATIFILGGLLSLKIISRKTHKYLAVAFFFGGAVAFIGSVFGFPLIAEWI